MAEESRPPSAGLFESLKTLLRSVVGIVHTRLELLSVEIAEERDHLIVLLVLVQSALFFLGVGVVLLAVLVAVAFAEGQRLLALGVLGGLFVLAGAGVAWLALRRTRTRPRLFAASLEELSKDRQHLGPGS
jgi:uncharacterized membrane protein YqjE